MQKKEKIIKEIIELKNDVYAIRAVLIDIMKYDIELSISLNRFYKKEFFSNSNLLVKEIYLKGLLWYNKNFDFEVINYIENIIIESQDELKNTDIEIGNDLTDFIRSSIIGLGILFKKRKDYKVIYLLWSYSINNSNPVRLRCLALDSILEIYGIPTHEINLKMFPFNLNKNGNYLDEIKFNFSKNFIEINEVLINKFDAK